MKRKFMLAVSNTYCDVLRYDVGNPCPGLGRHTNVEEINQLMGPFSDSWISNVNTDIHMFSIEQ